MGTKRRISGCVAVAHAVRLADVDVICSYPIRPYTGIMSELARMVADGELDAEFIHGEGEHGQLSVVYGASAAGARAFTGSSGVGVTYAMEVYSPIAGERLPLQMAIADRTLDPPGDFGSEHTDALCGRDQGWLQGWASTPQEALDMSLMYYRIGEDPRVLLPQFACQDGYYVSHILGEVDIPDQAQVKEFLPPYKNRHTLDPVSYTHLDVYKRQSRSSNGMPGYLGERLLSQLLLELSGMEALGAVVIIAATNRIDRIDPALLRSGRFDEIIEFSAPDCHQREEIFRVCLRSKPLQGLIRFQELARDTEGLVGADIAAVCRRAALLVITGVVANRERNGILPEGYGIREEHLRQALAERKGRAGY